MCVSGASAAAAAATAQIQTVRHEHASVQTLAVAAADAARASLLAAREGAVALENHDLDDGPQLLRLHLRATQIASDVRVE